MKSLHFLLVLFIVLGTGAAAQKQAQERLPYTAIHDPQFIPASSATFLHDPDRVIGIVSGPAAKAYPAAILLEETDTGPRTRVWADAIPGITP
jgi:hypothetical protein